ncbi:MAG: hypothetical protein OXG35_27225 [Acidobacteria bacterium]|nr:hypothetical protein [Acidobacteriota bacterium]
MQSFTIDEETRHGCIVRICDRRMLVQATADQLRKLGTRTEEPIQELLPDATPDQREFLISGLEANEFDDLMAELEEAAREDDDEEE